MSVRSSWTDSGGSGAPVATIATPAASTAAITSSSRTEPPGWMIARDAGVDRQLGTVGEGEEGVGGERGAGEQLGLGGAGLLDRDAHGVDPAHLPGADADRGAVARR